MVIPYSFLGSFTIRAAVFMEFQGYYFRWQQRHPNTVHHPQASACWDSMRCKSFPKFSTCAKHDSVSILKKKRTPYRGLTSSFSPENYKLPKTNTEWKPLKIGAEVAPTSEMNHHQPWDFSKRWLGSHGFCRFCPRKPEVIKPQKNHVLSQTQSLQICLRLLKAALSRCDSEVSV